MKPLAALITAPRPPADDRDPTAFAHWVRKTSELIGRPYMQTFKLVQDWPLHKIERRYREAMDCGPDIKPAVKWWWLRKKEKGGS
mgnify:CR=1 FL=1